jgi:small subunit ribosomal protein S5
MAHTQVEGGPAEEVISIRYHTKVTKGGRNLSCAALVAVGDGEGRVGLGYGTAKAVPMAIEKGSKEARKRMVRVNLLGDTIVHEVVGKYKAATVLLRPAGPGTGIKAGATVRAIMRVVGVHNVLSKVFGNTNAVNLAKATMNALTQLRSVQETERLRGCAVNLFHPQVRRERPKPAEAGQEAAAAQ